MKRYKVELLGITYNQIESGVYAVILTVEGGSTRIPIVIGYPEAQAIECRLQNVITPRPLTHDLIISLFEEFNITLEEVEIRLLPEGVFAADLLLSDGISTHIIDSRASDAIAIAIRNDVPIYVSEDVVLKAGFDPNNNQHRNADLAQSSYEEDNTEYTKDEKLLRLRKQLKEAVDQEDYKQAAILKREINLLENDAPLPE